MSNRVPPLKEMRCLAKAKRLGLRYELAVKINIAVLWRTVTDIIICPFSGCNTRYTENFHHNHLLLRKQNRRRLMLMVPQDSTTKPVRYRGAPNSLTENASVHKEGLIKTSSDLDTEIPILPQSPSPPPQQRSSLAGGQSQQTASLLASTLQPSQQHRPLLHGLLSGTHISQGPYHRGYSTSSTEIGTHQAEVKGAKDHPWQWQQVLPVQKYGKPTGQ
uniref:Uncharacterized protein n=1 Tax=Anopheles culicifacies TaxID=139723 RepID=A0A182MCQ6_9DIPT